MRRAGFGWFWVVSGGFGSFRFLVITVKLMKDRNFTLCKKNCECSDSILSTSHTKSLGETIQIQDDAKNNIM